MSYRKNKNGKLFRILWIVFGVSLFLLATWQMRQGAEVPSFEEQIKSSLTSDLPAIVEIVEPVVGEIKNEVVEKEKVATVIDEPELNIDRNNFEYIVFDVPFTSQAPDAEWDDDRFQEGCEEASVLMAMSWVNDTGINKSLAQKEIIGMADYQLEEYGGYQDTNSADTVERLFNGYFDYYNVDIEYDIKNVDIKNELYGGNLVLVPTDGRRLANPYFTSPGPSTHMFVIYGYDPETEEFIVNDPGTKRGEAYRYNTSIVWEAILDYPTGSHEVVVNERKAMIVVRPRL